MQLFNEDTFMSTLPERDNDLMLALKSVALRFPPGSLTAEKKYRLESTAAEARRLVMNRVVSSQARLSSLQALCLLSIYNFTC